MAPIKPHQRSTLRSRARSSNSTTKSSTKPKSAQISTQHTSSSFPTHLPTASPHHTTTEPPSSLFTNTKKDKHLIRSSAFRSRIEKSHSKTRSKKRRRPSKKLITTLDDLVDALPDAGVSGNVGGNDGAQGVQADARDGSGLAPTMKIRQRSLKHKPGAMKRREALERSERERFQRNMASLIGTRAERDAEGGESGTNGGSGGGKLVLDRQVEDVGMTGEGAATEADDLEDTGRGAGQVKGTSTTAARWAALRSFISQTLEQRDDVTTR